MSTRAQGTIEYLVIIGIVVVISLVVVGLLMSQMDSSVNVSKTSGKIGGLAQSIGITESLISPTDGNFVVKLLNNSGSTITVSNVKIGDSNVNFSEDLAQSGSMLFKVRTDTNCELGKVVSQNVIVTYVTAEGLTKTEIYPAEVMFDCSPFVIAQANLANQCPTCSGDATVDKVLSPYTFSNSTATGLTGALVLDGNAQDGNVLTGYTYFNTSGTKRTGSMTDKSTTDSASSAQAQAGGVNYFTVPANGYYNTASRISATDAQVAALDANITEINIKKDTAIFGVTGTYEGAGGASIYEGYPLTWSGSLGGMNWAAAKAACAALATAGTWRLPTESELVAALRAQFVGGTEPNPGGFTDYTPYWSLSESDSDNAWVAMYEWGNEIYVYAGDKDDEWPRQVRCVH